MIRTYVASLAFFLVFSFTLNARPERSPHVYRLMAYNVGHLYTHIQRKSGNQLIRTPLYPRQTQQKADAILHADPDVLALIETESLEAVERFNRDFLNRAYRVVRIDANSTRGVEIALLVRANVYHSARIISYRNMPFFNHDLNRLERLWSRDVLTMLLFDAAGKPKLIFGGVHLQSMRLRAPGDADKIEAQELGLIEIYQNLQTKFGADVPLVFAGDFNRDLLIQDEFSELRKHMIEGFDAAPFVASDEERYTHAMPPFARVSRLTKKQLDGFFLASSLRARVMDTFTLPYVDCEGTLAFPSTFEERKRFGSDHRPVVLDLYLDEAKRIRSETARALRR